MKIYFYNLLSVKHLLPHGDTTFDPRPAPNYEQTKIKKIFSTASLFRTCCRLLNMEAEQH